MCGRFVQVSSPELLVEQFGVDKAPDSPLPGSYNVAPRATVYAVRDRLVSDADDQSDDPKVRRRYLSELRWGLIPSWAKDPKIGDRMINARSETVTDASAYKRAFERHRCLLPADGFYEWQHRGKGRRKQPMFVHRRDGRPMAFAGLWSAWRDPSDTEADWLRTCVIITTDANQTLAPIHDRMPVLLDERHWEQWLDPKSEDLGALRQLLVPAPDDLIVTYPVSPLVNKADNDGPELVEPYDPGDPGDESEQVPSLL